MIKEVKNNEVVAASEDENKEFNLFKEISDHGMVQPILYIRRVDGKEGMPKAAKLVSENDMLHTAPVNATHGINVSIADAVRSNENVYKSFMFDNLWKLANNQSQLYAEEVTNYVVQNTFISFCAMLDNTGRNFREIIDYLPIKRYVLEELNKNSSFGPGHTSDIFEIIYAFVSDYSKNSFVELFNSKTTNDDEIQKENAKLQAYCVSSSAQLSQMIYSKICSGCDRALTEYLLDDTPNIEYIVKAAFRYFNIKETEINARHEAYYRLNVTLVKMIDSLMKNCVCPMSDNFFTLNFFASFNYIFASLDRQYIDIRNKKYEEERKQLQENLNIEVTEF